MIESAYTEKNISLIGKSGNEYFGKIYDDKDSTTSLSGPVIVCLSNTTWEDNHWLHAICDIYTDDAQDALEHFKERDDISHLILIPNLSSEYAGTDKIDDLRRRYIHR